MARMTIRDLGYAPGQLPPGPKNSILDVKGMSTPIAFHTSTNMAFRMSTFLAFHSSSTNEEEFP